VIQHRAIDGSGRLSTDESTEDRATLALEVLEEHGEPLPLADVADEVAVREADCSLDEIAASEVLWIYDDLYYDHVPTLVGAGLVEYDQETDCLRRVEGVEVADADIAE
jgi:hypothetical protein